jgi:hypothetical protein
MTSLRLLRANLSEWNELEYLAEKLMLYFLSNSSVMTDGFSERIAMTLMNKVLM